MIFIFGFRATHIKTLPAPGRVCTCGAPMQMSFYGSYAHMFWIPAFPVRMAAFTTCMLCRNVSTQDQFDQDLRQTRSALRKQVRHPIWFYTLLIIIAVLFITALITAGAKSIK